MKWLRKTKYLIPLIMISAFPFYFKMVCQSYEWATHETGTQILYGALTVIILGLVGFSAVDYL